MPKRDQRLQNLARRFRANPTDTETLLWQHLRNRQLQGARFRRQHPIGPFIVDFYCVEHKLVIEIDGSQHAERTAQDNQRSNALAQHGHRVLRFWNSDVLLNIDGVLEEIVKALDHPHPNPLPQRERVT